MNSKTDWWSADAEHRGRIRHELLADARARVATSAPQLETCCELLLSAAVTLGFLGTALWLPTAGGALRNHGFAAVEPMPMFEAQSRDMEFLPGQGVPGRALVNGIEWIPNIILDDNFPRLRGAIFDLVRTVVGFSAVSGGRAVGVIEMFSRDVRQRDDTTVALVTTLGADLGSYIAQLGV